MPKEVQKYIEVQIYKVIEYQKWVIKKNLFLDKTFDLAIKSLKENMVQNQVVGFMDKIITNM